ncbi:MAG: protein translocase subunit SecD [Deltaproteobacteria bacterium]|nr:MAG: protein translocase subunit SecD [Deltaproteobacteria bacterium]
MGSNWWLKFVLTLSLIVLAVRALVPTFGYQKPELMPVFRVEYETNAAKQIVKDKDGKPKIKYEKIKSGKNKGKVLKDEDGNPVPIFARDKNGNCIPEWTFSKVQILDDKGQPKLDPKTKKPIIKTYKNRKSIYDRKKNEKPLDARREYVKVPRKDSKGNVVTYTKKVTERKITKQPKLDKNGKPVKDKNGKPVIKTRIEFKKVTKKIPVLQTAQMTDAVWARCYLPKWYQMLFPYKRKIRLGLDLQGGTHLVMNVDVDKALATKAASLAEDLNSYLLNKQLIPKPKAGESSRFVFQPSNSQSVEVTVPGRCLPKKTVACKKNSDCKESGAVCESSVCISAKAKYCEKSSECGKDQTCNTDIPVQKFRGLIGGGKFRDNVRLKPLQGTKFAVRYDDESIKRSRDAAISQAIETIRGRVDSLGVSEPSISRYGDTQIVIQLPGLKNPQRAKELIGKTALLAFHVVEDDHRDSTTIFASMSSDIPKGVTSQVQSYNRPNESKSASGYDRFFYGEDKAVLVKWAKKWNKKLAEGFTKGTYARSYVIMLGQYDNRQSAKEKKELPWRTYLMWRKPSLTGEVLEEARPQIDSQNNRPEVGLNFNLRGADLFESMTGAHIGHRFAIVLEGKVDSAPVIQTRIGGGRARITLGGMGGYEQAMQDAKDLAFVLKSGSLPAPVDILYEKTIGPALGRDSIRRGLLSLLIGFILVLLFMIVYYRASGFNAVIALLLNMLFVTAAMASFGATLTLPGMAGILLTIGMAVDANILIFERIREEITAGKAVRVAVQNGYDKAFVTIIDANITTAIAGIVLYQYGSGPIRGFAVTLLIGIICSVFTALFVTRLLFDLFVRDRRVGRLSI